MEIPLPRFCAFGSIVYLDSSFVVSRGANDTTKRGLVMDFIRDVWDDFSSSSTSDKIGAGIVVAVAIFALLLFVADGVHAARCDMGYDEPITCAVYH